MQRFFVETNQIDIENKVVIIIGEDVNHIINVLRYNEKDKFEVAEKSSNPRKFICSILEKNKNEIKCLILNEINISNESNLKISVFQGIPKLEKMEIIIQKCTELGAYDFYPVEMQRCVAKITSKDVEKKTIRWQKIAEVASKQCGRDIIPIVHNKISLKDFTNIISSLDILIVAYENEDKNSFAKAIEKINRL